MPQLRQSYVSVDLQKMLTLLKVKINTVFIRWSARLLNFWTLRVGAYSRLGACYIFYHFNKCSMFIMQQNNKW